MKNLYIHIPFCNKICSYCDFCKILYFNELVDKYLASLQKEIQEKYNGEELETIYIGGGTPSSLSVLQLEKLFSITNKLNINDSYEFTIEFNIEDITQEKLLVIKNNKVNRISVGIQTINQKFYDLLGRNNKKEEVINKINLCKQYFENINIDLMYGFNNQTIEDLDKDIEFFLNLDIPHISTYSLILEEHTKLFIDNYKNIDEDIESNMYYHIIKRLKDNGFNHYEISNFSKEGYKSEHNLCYWNNENYYGFGLGASGYIDNLRYTNTRSLNNYLKGNYIIESETLTQKDKMQYEMICGLRKISGISKKQFYEKYNCDVKEVFDIEKLIKNKDLIETEDRIFIPEEKLYISNQILVKFLD